MTSVIPSSRTRDDLRDRGLLARRSLPVPLQVSGPDPLEVDAFYRYHETIQRFFDRAAEVETRYEE